MVFNKCNNPITSGSPQVSPEVTSLKLQTAPELENFGETHLQWRTNATKSVGFSRGFFFWGGASDLDFCTKTGCAMNVPVWNFNITSRGLKWRDTSPVLVMFKWDITENLFCCSFFVAVPVATKNITTSSTVKTRLTSLFAPPQKGLLDAPHITSIRIIIKKGETTIFL